MRDLFGFSEVEWALIEDMVAYTVAYFKTNKPYPVKPTTREKTGGSELELYADFFLKVLTSGFGTDKRITFVAFTERPDQPKLPVRLLAVYLDSPLDVGFQIEEISADRLYSRLAQLHQDLMAHGSPNAGGICFQRVARIYDVTEIMGKRVPTVYMIKPDEVRYWTRSMALRDADEVAADIMSWVSSHSHTRIDKEGIVESTAHPV